MHRTIALGWLAAALVLAAGCAREEPAPIPPPGGGATDVSVPAEGGRALRIAVIPKGTTHEFWKSVHAGAVKAERELDGVRIIWQGPTVEDDRTGQINLVETFVQDKVDGIVLAPLDDTALVRPVNEAKEAGIPVVIIDSGLADPAAYVSFVATDNTRGGALAAERMKALLPDGGKIIVMRYQIGSASTQNREDGFLEVAREAPGLEIVSDNQFGGATVDSARQKADALLARFPAGQVDGIFCPNESTTYGMLEALRGAGRAGKAQFVGFDISPKLIDAIQQGDLMGTVVQNPVRMGYEGVKACVAAIRGEPVEKRIDTGVVLVTKENLADPAVQEVIHPPLDKYLGE